MLAFCFVAASRGLGQDIASGQISGVVTAPNGTVLSRTEVLLQSVSSNAAARRAETDKAGRYSFTGLPFGTYKLSASASGFRGSEPRLVILAAARVIADVVLTPLESGAQTSKAGDAPPKAPPAFSTATARGTIAPSGYSSGLSLEETAHVRASANALEPTLFNILTGEAQIDCGQESTLLREVEKSPHNFNSNHALGVFYLGHGDYAKATEYLGEAHSLAPAELATSRDLAMAMIGSGNTSDALVLLKRTILVHASDSTLLRLLALAYGEAGERNQSEAAFLTAAASDPAAENQYDCGIGLIQLGALDQAFDLFVGATKAHPESARLWLGMGITEHLLDRKEPATSALLRSADADSNFLPPLSVLAEFSGLPNQTEDEVRRRIAAYLAAHPEDPDAHVAYALVLSKQTEQQKNSNTRQEVAAQLKHALQLNPRIARAHFLLGDMEADANNVLGAINEFVEGLELEPRNSGAHYRLSLLYRRSGQQEAAHKEMDTFQALHTKPDDGPSMEAIGMLSRTTQPVAGRSCGSKPE